MGALIQNSTSSYAGRYHRRPARTELRWLGGQLLHVPLHRLVARSKKLVAYHTRPGHDHQGSLHRIRRPPINPAEALVDLYRKPGDALDIASPALFEIATKRESEIDTALFPNAYNLHPPSGEGWPWLHVRIQSARHQVYRVVEVDAHTAQKRAIRHLH